MPAPLPPSAPRFDPALVKYRGQLGEGLLIWFVLQLFGIVSPLFFQVVMDKVLVHKGIGTLDVLLIGLVVVVIRKPAHHPAHLQPQSG